MGGLSHTIPFSCMLTVPSGGWFLGVSLFVWFGFGDFVRGCLGFLYRVYGYCLFKEG